MGLFDGISNAFKNALANEDLPPAPPDGLSQVCALFIWVFAYHASSFLQDKNIPVLCRMNGWEA
jgi:hypothetical protein